MNLIFYINHDSETFLFKNLIKVIKRKLETNIIVLIPEKENRIKIKSYSCFDKVQKIPSLNYSKNIFKLLLNHKKLKNQLKNLFEGQDFTFISFEPYSLNSIFLSSYFKRNKTVVFSTNYLNSTHTNRKINLFKTIIYSFNSILVSKKIVKYYLHRSTNYHSIDVKINCDYYVTLGNTDFKSCVSASNKINIKNHPALYYRTKSSLKNNVHVLIITLVKGQISNQYLDFLKKSINYFNDNKIKFIVKDHPSSIYSNEELINIFKLKKNQHLDKYIHIEDYFIRNYSKISCIYGPNTTALRSANFLELNNVCYHLIFEKREIYIKHVENYFKSTETILISNIDEFIYYVNFFKNKINVYKTYKINDYDYDFLY